MRKEVLAGRAERELPEEAEVSLNAIQCTGPHQPQAPTGITDSMAHTVIMVRAARVDPLCGESWVDKDSERSWLNLTYPQIRPILSGKICVICVDKNVELKILLSRTFIVLQQ